MSFKEEGQIHDCDQSNVAHHYSWGEENNGCHCAARETQGDAIEQHIGQNFKTCTFLVLS